MTPGAPDGLDGLFAGQTHQDWTDRTTRGYALAAITGAVQTAELAGLALVWWSAGSDWLARLLIATVAAGSLVASGLLVRRLAEDTVRPAEHRRARPRRWRAPAH